MDKEPREGCLREILTPKLSCAVLDDDLHYTRESRRFPAQRSSARTTHGRAAQWGVCHTLRKRRHQHGIANVKLCGCGRRMRPRTCFVGRFRIDARHHRRGPQTWVCARWCGPHVAAATRCLDVQRGPLHPIVVHRARGSNIGWYYAVVAAEAAYCHAEAFTCHRAGSGHLPCAARRLPAVRVPHRMCGV